MNNKEKEKILNKAKNTKYKHRIWSLEHMGIDTVYGFMKWAAKGNGMYLDVKRSIKYLSDIPEIYEAELKNDQLKETYTRQEIVDLCIKHKNYKDLVIISDERGTDRGILKIKTYLILKGLI